LDGGEPPPTVLCTTWVEGMLGPGLLGGATAWLIVLGATGATGAAGVGAGAGRGAGGFGGLLRAGTAGPPASGDTDARGAGTETAGASEVAAGGDELERVTAPMANAAANARAVTAINAIELRAACSDHMDVP
jgi:hypothetical protein